MDISSIVFVSTILLLTAMAMLVSHVRTWRTFLKQDFEADEFYYRRRQFRRRMQTSAMLGLLAIALPVGCWLTVWLESGWFVLVFWTSVMGVACWVALLAVVDIWATKRHFGRLHERCLLEQAKLRAEMHRLCAGRGNGKAGKIPLGKTEKGGTKKEE